MNKKILIIISLFTAIVIHTTVFFVPASLMDGYFSMIKPMFWIIVFFFTYSMFNKTIPYAKNTSAIRLITILGIIIYLFALFISGFFLKYSFNPMSSSFRGILLNIWTYVPIIFIKEYVRSKIMISAKKNNKYMVIAIVAIVFTYLSIDNIKSVVALSLASKADYLLTTILPLLVINIFLTFTAGKGAMGSNMLFQIIYAGLPIFCPVLPNTPKIYEAILIYTIMFIMFIIYDKMSWDKNRKDTQNEIKSKYRWQWLVAPAIVLTVCLLFGFGAFSFVPFAVGSQSMKGTINVGDIVLVKKISKIDMNDIKEGDIIQYRTGSITIAHRVVEIRYNPQAEKLYVTKGDNNEIVDTYPIRENQIIGVVLYRIPYIGWPSIFFTRLK